MLISPLMAMKLNRKEQITAVDAFCVFMMDYLVTVLKTKKRLNLFQKKSLVSRRGCRKSLNLPKMENVYN